MKNKEDMFLVGLIVVIIVLVVALFMTPVKVEVVGSETDASAAITISTTPREALPVQIEETVEEVEEVVKEPIEEELEDQVEPVPEPEPETVVISLMDSRFTPNDVTVESGTIIMWENNEKYDARQIDLVAYGKHTYSPKLKPGESWSITLTGPTVYYYCAVGYESRKARIKVEG